MADKESLNTSEAVEQFDDRAHDDNYVLNQIRDFYGGGGGGIQPIGQQPDGDYVGRKATGEAISIQRSLSDGETLTTDWLDTDGWGALDILVVANDQGRNEGVVVQYTDDANTTTPDVVSSETRTYSKANADEGSELYSFGTTVDGARVKYTNGDTPTDVTLIGTLQQSVDPDTARFVSQDKFADNYVRVGTGGDKPGVEVKAPSSLFGDLTTITRRPVVDLTSSFGTSELRDEVTTTGSGVVAEDPDSDTGEIVLSTGATADSSVELRSAEYGRYTPGYSAQQGAGIRFDSLPSEGEVKWGYFDDDDGFYWGYDGSEGELFVGRRKNGSEAERVYESSFNGGDFGQIFDKKGPDPRTGYIYQIDFSWYGYGILEFSIVAQTADDGANDPSQVTASLHRIVVEESTTISDANQPISVVAENAGGGEDVRVRVGGRQYTVLGELPSDERITAATVEDTTVAGGAWTHVMSWRRSTAVADPNARLSVSNIDFALDQTVRVALVQNAALSGTNFVTPDLVDADETLVEVSKDGTFDGLDGGTKTWEGSLQVAGTGTAQDTLNPDVNQRFGQNIVVSLIAKGIGGSGSGISTMRISEDW